MLLRGLLPGTRTARHRLTDQNHPCAAMTEPFQTASENEAQLRVLADKLLFKVEKLGERFTLTRTADVSRPVRHKDLTLEEAEQLLGTWKLRGLGGG
jgi:hypothetical protein